MCGNGVLPVPPMLFCKMLSPLCHCIISTVAITFWLIIDLGPGTDDIKRSQDQETFVLRSEMLKQELQHSVGIFGKFQLNIWCWREKVVAVLNLENMQCLDDCSSKLHLKRRYEIWQEISSRLENSEHSLWYYSVFCISSNPCQ